MTEIPIADYITFTAAAKHCPGRPYVSTVWRWATRGISDRAGGRLRLQYISAGGKLFTTLAWLQAYFDAGALVRQTEPTPAPTRTVRKPTSAQRARRIEDARRELAAS